jgi:hypothetical protein
MSSEADFVSAYDALAENTDNFRDVSAQRLAEAITAVPGSLAPLRMILGLTHNELAVAMQLVDPTSKASGASLKNFERRSVPSKPLARRVAMINTICAASMAAMNRTILAVPPGVADVFHSKLDRRDTRLGWTDVARDAGRGVPYSALLYQRYVGGIWRQVQDAYSEAKGDNLLEIPLEHLFQQARMAYFRTPPGARGARLASTKYGLNPAPDFILPDVSPTVVIEAKVGEDGGTVRDKASRIKNLATAAHAKGLIACAVVDGKGWRERPSALLDVIVATEGRTYTLNTLPQMVELPELASLVSSAP